MRMAPATRWGSRRATGRCHLGGSTAAARTIGGGASVLGGGGAALGGQLITQADVFMWRCLLPWRASRSVLKAGALTLDPQATCSLHSARPLSNRPRPALEPAFSFVSYLTPDGSSQGCTDSLSLPASWRLMGLLSAVQTGLGQVGVQVRERVLTYLSSGVRMIETPDPANCASCPENYYSACPVQRTKGPVTEAVNSARHREALALPPSGRP